MNLWERPLEAHRYEEAQAKIDRVRDVLRPFQIKSAKRSGGYRFNKGLSAALGRPVGPTRPPTLPLNDQEIAELQGILRGIGWLAAD